jgi:hypothetical protein
MKRQVWPVVARDRGESSTEWKEGEEVVGGTGGWTGDKARWRARKCSGLVRV